MSAYQAVLFDFDGTLAPSLHLWTAAYQRSLAEHGVVLSEDETIERCFYRPYAELVEEFILPTSGSDFSNRMLHHLLELFLSVSLFPFAREALEECQALGIKLGCVSSAPRANLVQSLERLGIAPFFEVITSGDDVVRFKPAPEPVQRTVHLLGVAEEECLMIGDYTVDVQAGRAAGVKTALFYPADHHRYYTIESLLESGPDLVFRCHSELIAHLSPSGPPTRLTEGR